MSPLVAKIWIVLAGILVATWLAYVIWTDLQRGFAVGILVTISLITLAAINALGDSKATELKPKTAEPEGFFYSESLFATIGPVTEQTKPAIPGWKWHHPTRRAQMSLILTDSQQATITLSGGPDKKGHPGGSLPPGVPAWTVSDSTILSVVPAADGLSAVVASIGTVLGTAQVQATLGTLTPYVSDVQVVAGPPASLVGTIGTPTEQP